MAPRVRRLIYLDGPLFSEAERLFNHRLTSTLEEAGFRVFMRQGEDLRGRRVLFVLDGRGPDEGACLQLGIAHSLRVFEHLEKLLV